MHSCFTLILHGHTVPNSTILSRNYVDLKKKWSLHIHSKGQNQFPKMHIFANVSKMRNLWTQNGNLSQCAISHKLTSKPNDVQRNLILIQLSKGSFWSCLISFPQNCNCNSDAWVSKKQNVHDEHFMTVKGQPEQNFLLFSPSVLQANETNF